MANRPADDYEAKYMDEDGAVLYRDKIKAPWYMHALLLGSGAAGIVGTALGGEPLIGALLVAPVTAFVWTNFVALRVTVTDRTLYVQYGLFGPKIAIDDIVSVKAGKYNWLKYGGKGIRLGLDGSTAYNMLGDKHHGVEITYKKGRRTRTILVSSTDPEALAQSILEAKAKAGASVDSALTGAREDLGLLDAPAGDLVPGAELSGEDAELVRVAEQEVEKSLAEG